MNGDELFEFVKLLFPLNRSIMGMGTRKTLDVIKQFSPDLKIISFPSGTKCFDWEIPLEWNVASAYIIDPNGEKIIDFLDNNLHLVSYSEPVNRKMSLGELSDHLFSLPHQPNLIPYRTSYYESFWGFCIKDEMRQKLVEGEYTVCIDSSLEPGSLDIGEIYIEGLSKSEIVSIERYTSELLSQIEGMPSFI
jgi:aminopeptidase-like protein